MLIKLNSFHIFGIKLLLSLTFNEHTNNINEIKYGGFYYLYSQFLPICDQFINEIAGMNLVLNCYIGTIVSSLKNK